MKKCDKRSIREIADSLKGKIGVVKGDKSVEHKKKTGIAK